jgi:WD40 repeat protein
MAYPWKTVRVFISSTFHDIQSERDHLIRFIFPKLREHLLTYHIHLVDVDLRWGVTSEENVLEVCREIVDECHPRFLCILGGRYGWVPPGKEQSITADEVHYGVLDRRLDERGFAFFFFRDDASTAAMIESIPGEFREAHGSAGEIKLAELKQAIVGAGLNPFTYSAHWDNESRRLIGLKEFGERVYDNLLESIETDPNLTDRFSANHPIQIDEFEEETATMESFIEEHCELFVLGSREQVLTDLLNHAIGSEGNGYMCLTGTPGSGKSALLAFLTKNRAFANPQSIILISHFVGASPSSTNIYRTLRRICYALKAGCSDSTAVIPDDPEKLEIEFSSFLQQACEKNRVVLIIDAINQFDFSGQIRSLHWLPDNLPATARIIFSAIDSPVLEELRLRRVPPREKKLNPLTEHDTKAIIAQFSRRYRKRFEREQCAALMEKEDSNTPLYLLAALEELRTLGRYEEITMHINQMLPTVNGLLKWILRRLEHDDGFRDAQGRFIGHEIVPGFASCIAVSRHGLGQSELFELLSPGDTKINPPISSDAQGNVASLLHLLRPYLMYRGELLDFCHIQFRDAAKELYLGTDSRLCDVNGQLAEFFRNAADPDRNNTWSGASSHAFSELPFHLTYGKKHADLTIILTDLKFISSKSRLCGLFDVLDDYSIYRLYSGKIFDEDTPVSDFERFISNEAHFLKDFPELLFQEAYNANSRKYVHSAAVNLLDAIPDCFQQWLRRVRGTTRQFHNGQIISMTFLKGDEYLPPHLAVSTIEREVWLWDITNRELLRRFATPPSAAKSLVVSPNGKFLASGFGADKPSPFVSGVIIWNNYGGLHRRYDIADWVYTLRWRDDTRLVAGTGLPLGSEAGGLISELNLNTAGCIYLSGCLSDRPIVLTWEPLFKSPNLMMALSMDGNVYVCGEGDSCQDPIYRMKRPETDIFGYFHAVEEYDRNEIFVLHENELSLYGFNTIPPSQTLITNPSITDETLTCLSTLAYVHCLIVGTLSGQVLKFSLSEIDMPPEKIHQGNYPITSVCFSKLGTYIAVGDSGGQIHVYERRDNKLVFQTERSPLLYTVRFQDSRIIILYDHQLRIIKPNSNAPTTEITLSDGLIAIDFDALDDLAAVLCRSPSDQEGNESYYIQIVNLAAERVVLSVDIPFKNPDLLKVKTLLGNPCPYNHIRLNIFNEHITIIIGSYQGMVVYPPLNFSSGRALVLPLSITNKIGFATRYFDIPFISCDLFEISPHTSEILCGYSNNTSFESDSGLVYIWNCSTGAFSTQQNFDTPILSISFSDHQKFIIGTVNGEASSWSFDGEWHRFAFVKHPVAVVATAYSKTSSLACSASSDGLLLVWDSTTGITLFRTFLDIKPVSVDFINNGKSVGLVDVYGEVHIWEIVERDQSICPFLSSETCGRRDEHVKEIVNQYFEQANILATLQAAITAGNNIDVRSFLSKHLTVSNKEEIIEEWSKRADRSLNSLQKSNHESEKE